MSTRPLPHGSHRSGRWMHLLPTLFPALLAACLLALWQAWTAWQDVPAYVLPSPWLIAQTLVADWPLLSQAWLVTMKVTLLAFVWAVVLGSSLACVMVQSRWLEAALLPYAIGLQVTPIVAIAPLVIIWVQDPATALVVCATLVAIFPIISNTTVGLRSAPAPLLAYFALQGATRWQTLLRLRLPCALPYVLAGWRISSGLALIGAVVAEFVAGTGGQASGLAFQILQSGYQLNIPRMFAALLLIVATGLLLFGAVSLLTRACLGRWHDSERLAA